MIQTDRLFKREAPSREAKSIYIFCEGVKREYQYFKYFREMDSRINVEVYKLHPHEDNSPLGLLGIAEKCIIPDLATHNPKYAFQQNDEVWIVLDTDKDKDSSRQPQIKQVRDVCRQRDGWFVAESNPCFEVWLYYHCFSAKPDIENHMCDDWKRLINNAIKGGFNSKRHPIYIETAQKNAEKNYLPLKGKPNTGSTEVFKLSKSILPLVKVKIKEALKKLESQNQTACPTN